MVVFDAPARVVDGAKGKVVPAGDFPKTVVYDRWKAKDVCAVSNGVWLVDMGVNFAGTFRVTLRNTREDQVVKFRKGELKHADNTVNGMRLSRGRSRIRPEDRFSESPKNATRSFAAMRGKRPSNRGWRFTSSATFRSRGWQRRRVRRTSSSGLVGRREGPLGLHLFQREAEPAS